MYARIAFFEDHAPAQIDELLRRLEERSRHHAEVLPESRAFLALVDREAGKSIGITFFDTREAMEASEEALASFPRTYAESLKGRRVGLEVYEVGVADRPSEIKVGR
jgi:class 3 adenylate cyclase